MIVDFFAKTFLL